LRYHDTLLCFVACCSLLHRNKRRRDSPRSAHADLFLAAHNAAFQLERGNTQIRATARPEHAQMRHVEELCVE
jgi:hypothetical protein